MPGEATTKILVKWDNVCNDESWIASLLSWYDEKAGSNVVCLDVNTAKRPDVFEWAMLHHDDLTIRTMDGSIVLAQQAHFATGAEDAQGIESILPRRSAIKLRYSDLHALQTTPHTFYYQMMSNSVNEDRPKTRRVQQEILVPNAKLEVGDQVSIAFCNKFAAGGIGEWYFEVCNQATGIKLCTGRWWLDPLALGVEPRYDMTKLIANSPALKDEAHDSREVFHLPIVETTPFFKFEMQHTNKGNGWLHLADIAVTQAREQAFPRGSLFYTALQANGSRQFACMWRGAAAQIFFGDEERIATQTAFSSTVWIDRTGGSTFDLRADFFTMDTTAAAASLVASVRFTLITVDISTKKPRQVFYDRSWAEKRYSYGKQSLTSPESFALRVNPESWAGIKPYSYALELRHSDHDLNGHVNSGRYMTLVEDARFAAICAGHAGPQHAIGANWMKNFWIEYNEELHMSSAHCAYIEVKFQGVFTRFEFLYGGATRKLCAIVTVESPGQWSRI